MRGPGSHHYTLDWAGTGRARLPFPAIHRQPAEVLSRTTVGQQVCQVVECGATALDRALQHLAGGVQEGAQLIDRHEPSRCERMDPGSKEHLIGVDVAQAGKRSLIQEQRLDGCCSAGESVGEGLGLGGTLPSVRSQTRHPGASHLVLVVDRDESKRSRVDEPNLGPVVQCGDEVSMRHRLILGLADGETARHPEMRDHRVAVIEIEDEELAMAADRLDATPSQPDLDLVRGGVVARGSGVGDGHVHEQTARHRIRQVAPGHLDFRKLGQMQSPRRAGYGNPAMKVPPRPFGAVLGEGMNNLGRIWRPLLTTSLIVFIPTGILTLMAFNATGGLDFMDVVMNDPESLETITRGELFALAEPFLWAVGIAIALQSIASVYVYLASHRMISAEVSGEPISGPTARREAAASFGRGLMAAIIVFGIVLVLFGIGLSIWLIPFVLVGTPNAASVLVALVLLVAVAAPSIWLSVSFSMVTSVVAIDGLGPVKSLARSFRLVRPRWWPTLGYLLLVGLIGSVAAQLIQILAIPLTVIGDTASGFTMASLFGVAFQGVLVAGIAAMYTQWYIDLRARAEDLSTEDLS